MVARRRGVLTRVISGLYFSVVAIAIILFAVDADWGLNDIAVSWAELPQLLGAIVVGLTARLCLAGNWFRMLRQFPLRLRTSLLQRITIYASSWLGRYLPGKIGPIVVRTVGYKELGVDRRHVLISSVVETALQIAAYVGLSLVVVVTVPELGERLGFSILVAFGVLGGLIAITTPQVLIRIARVVTYPRGMQPLVREDIPDGKSNIITVLIATAVTGLNGVFLFLISVSVMRDGASPGLLLYSAGIAAVASAASLLAVFAPGGVGVVEAVIVAGLVFWGVEPAAALSAAILWRIISIVTDIFFWAIPQTMRFFVER